MMATMQHSHLPKAIAAISNQQSAITAIPDQAVLLPQLLFLLPTSQPIAQPKSYDHHIRAIAATAVLVSTAPTIHAATSQPSFRYLFYIIVTKIVLLLLVYSQTLLHNQYILSYNQQLQRYNELLHSNELKLLMLLICIEVINCFTVTMDVKQHNKLRIILIKYINYAHQFQYSLLSC